MALAIEISTSASSISSWRQGLEDRTHCKDVEFSEFDEFRSSASKSSSKVRLGERADATGILPLDVVCLVLALDFDRVPEEWVNRSSSQLMMVDSLAVCLTN
mmetsp:Transcript_64720/g.186063  ORF Transcript_64720/g.186063 Transcript_64720/m.186063 type:complete len:102 (+) Transcript_64720:133-438(+)